MVGESYQIFVSQSGRMNLSSFTIRLTCTEEATFRQGTDIQVEHYQSHSIEVFRRNALEIMPGIPFEVELDLTIPEGVMHSFEAENNKIAWALEICGHIPAWPDFKRRFPLVIRPAQQEGP